MIKYMTMSIHLLIFLSIDVFSSISLTAMKALAWIKPMNAVGAISWRFN